MSSRVQSLKVSPETLTTFKRAVLHRHGKIRGALAKEAETALLAHAVLLGEATSSEAGA